MITCKSANNMIINENCNRWRGYSPLTTRVMKAPDMALNMLGRVCTRCKEWKPAPEFSVTKRDGQKARCKSCDLEYQKQWRKQNPERVAKKRKRAYQAWRVKNPKLPSVVVTTEDGRFCRVCGERKSPDDFYVDRRSADGKSYRCKKCSNRTVAEWRKNNEGHARNYGRDRANVRRASGNGKFSEFSARLKARFGITGHDLKKLMDEQNGQCAICSKGVFCSYGEPSVVRGKPSKDTACIDHCHNTGRVRGVLCLTCNTGIGQLKDDVTIVKAALEYLVKHVNFT